MDAKRTMVSKVTERVFRGLYSIFGKVPMPSGEVSMTLKEGQPAPDFAARADDGRMVRLSDYRGKAVVLYFYPKDDTPGCTVQACSFRDDMAKFKEAGAEILGVSVDSVDSHRDFKDKYRLPFTLLADVDGAVSRSYGVYGERKMSSRWTYIIDKEGVIRKIFPSVRVDGHSREVLSALP